MFQLYLIIMRLDMNNHVIQKHDQLWAEAYEIKPRDTRVTRKTINCGFFLFFPSTQNFRNFENFWNDGKLTSLRMELNGPFSHKKSQNFAKFSIFGRIQPSSKLHKHY